VGVVNAAIAHRARSGCPTASAIPIVTVTVRAAIPLAAVDADLGCQRPDAEPPGAAAYLLRPTFSEFTEIGIGSFTLQLIDHIATDRKRRLQFAGHGFKP